MDNRSLIRGLRITGEMRTLAVGQQATEAADVIEAQAAQIVALTAEVDRLARERAAEPSTFGRSLLQAVEDFERLPEGKKADYLRSFASALARVEAEEARDAQKVNEQ